MTCDDNRVLLRIGTRPIALPEPVAALARALLADPRHRLNTAAHPNSPWLFPGIIPGRPMHIATIHKTLTNAGFPLQPTRAGAWHQLVRQALPSRSRRRTRRNSEDRRQLCNRERRGLPDLP